VEALNNLGTVSEAMGDTAAALNYYQQALSLEPNAPDPKHNLAALRFRTGVSALRLGQDSLAAANLEECLLLQPTAIVHYDLAIAYGRLGRQTQAIKHLDIALRIDPNFAEAIRLREQIETEMKASPTDDAAAPNRDSSQ